MIGTYLCAAIVSLGLALAPVAALAHATKEATLPADGALLQISPETIRMSFDMPMRVTLCELRDDEGRTHDLTRTDNMQPVTDFEAVPGVLPAGRYTIEWRGLASDGHAMSGRFSFEIEG
jgi:methionine-rich copper-binding protein CopC